jgi:hypothetical protein
MCAARNAQAYSADFLCFESPDFPDIFSCSSSARKKHMACSKKHKAYILKYKALILKYVPYIFDVYKTLFLRCLEKTIFRGIFGRIFWVGR